MATDAAGEHSDELADFGYNQTLDRSIGKFASFAAGISYISILTGTFQLGGPGGTGPAGTSPRGSSAPGSSAAAPGKPSTTTTSTTAKK